jgi:glycosyltransferase involved in cell wall biosynthesis
MLFDTRLNSRNLTCASQLAHQARLDALAFLVGVLLAKLLTLLIVSTGRVGLSSLESTSSTRKLRGEIGVLVPVIPDISHTFIYRQILEMLRQGARFDVFALEKGDYSILHLESKALLERTIFIGKLSEGRYLLLYFYFLLTRPMRLARLIRFYKSQGNGTFLFLDFAGLKNTLHPSAGIPLAWELMRRNIEYLHVYGSYFPSTRGLVVSFLLNIPFSITAYVDFDHDYEFKTFSEKVELARFTVATTQFCANRIHSLTSDALFKKVYVIYFGVDENLGTRELGTGPESFPIFVAVGRLVKKKGFDYLIRAVAIMKSRGFNISAVIIGDGPDKGRLISLSNALKTENEVHFVGSLPNDQVAERYLKPQNILIAPSIYARGDAEERDGIPTVLLEAMILGVPVITTEVSGIPELISHEKNGILVEPQNEVALANAMEHLIKNINLKQRLGEEGRKTILRNFTVQKSSSLLWALIERESVLKNHQKSD